MIEDMLRDAMEWRRMQVQMAVSNGSLEEAEVDGEIWAVHPRGNCWGEFCVIHKPSTHLMSTWKRNLRESGLVERLCPKHGIGHPDPDSLAWFDSRGYNDYGVHGCCGCCGGREF